MKKFIIGAAFAAISSASAFAADLPMQSYKSPPVVAQVFNWTGFYVGVNGGYGWGTQDPLTLFSNRFDRSPLQYQWRDVRRDHRRPNSAGICRTRH